MARPIVVTVGPIAASNATLIRAALTSNAGAMSLTGSLATVYTLPNGQRVDLPAGSVVLDSPRQILFTNAAAETGKTIVVTGLDRQGNLQSETVTLGGIGSTATLLSYAVLFSAILSANSAGTISIGTNGVSESQWVRLDEWALQRAGLQVDINGTVNYSVFLSFDDPNSPTNPVAPAAMTWFASTDAGVVNATAAKQSVLDPVPIFAKLVLNSGTGSATMTVSQMGVAPY